MWIQRNQESLTAIFLITVWFLMFKLEHQPAEYINYFLVKGEHNKAQEFAESVVAAPLMYFVPNGAQEKFIQTFAQCTQDTKIPVILATYANGVGKSTITVVTLLNVIFHAQSGWFDYPIFHRWKLPRLCWYCSTADAINETIFPLVQQYASKEFTPEFAYSESKEGKRIVSKVHFPRHNWTIVFKTYEQKDQTFESANVGLIINDEPAPEMVWKAEKSRRRMGCITLLPMTPLNCEPYILDEIKRASDDNRPGYYHLKASVYDACKQRGIRGHLDPRIIDDMVADYDDDERDARAYGEFMYFSRSVYGDLLKKDLHFIDPSDYPIPQYSKIVQAVDPHDSRPSACLYAAKVPGKIQRYIIFQETPQEQNAAFWDMKRSNEIVDEVQTWDKIEKTYYKPAVRILDRHFGWQTRGQKTFAQLYLAAGRQIGSNFTFISSYAANSDESELAFGHKQVRKLLQNQEDGKPGILIYSNCYHLWNGLTHYVRKRLKGVASDDKIGVDAGIVEKYKDFPDCLRYLVCHDVVVRAPERVKSTAGELRRLASQGIRLRGEFAR